MEQASTTKECVELININHRSGKWKRQSKFTIINEGGEEITARVFSDGIEIITLLHTNNNWVNSTWLLPNIDLRDFRDTFDAVRERAKTVYSHDYNDIFFNPYTQTLWVVGGDGGIWESNLPPKEVVKQTESGTFEYGDDFPSFDMVPNVEFEAEYFPPILDEEEQTYSNEECFFKIGNYNDIGDVEAQVYEESKPIGQRIEEAERKLQYAVSIEDYKRAAELRDEIIKLKQSE